MVFSDSHAHLLISLLRILIPELKPFFNSAGISKYFSIAPNAYDYNVYNVPVCLCGVPETEKTNTMFSSRPDFVHELPTTAAVYRSVSHWETFCLCKGDKLSSCVFLPPVDRQIIFATIVNFRFPPNFLL